MTQPFEPADHEFRVREAQVREARLRLSRLETEMHRMRAELARLEAAGEEAEAERLERELRQHEGHIDRERHLFATEPVSDVTEHVLTKLSRSESKKSASTRPNAPIDSSAAKKRPAGAGKEGSRRSAQEQTAEPIVITINKTEAAEEPARGLFARLSPRRKLPAWVVSLAVHVVLLLMFGLFSFATITQAPPLLQASANDGADEFFDDLPEINFDDLTEEDLEVEDLTTELDAADFNEVELAEFDSPLANTDSAILSPTAFDALPADLGSLMTGVEAGGGAGQGGDGANRGGAPRGGAKFFGARSQGGSFVFVVDNSASMRDGRLETTLFEIQRSVDQMADNQRFYVLFYSDQAYPMFYPSSTSRLEFATRDNKRNLSAWLGTVEMAYGGQLIEAMRIVEKLNPDTVFLLSDGALGRKSVRYMTERNAWRFSINTLGMTVKEPVHAQNLVAIANAHNGVYSPVAVLPAAAQLASQQPRRRWTNRTGPGPIWGTKVRKDLPR